jgi:protein-S-isoprenylcysteine O-methyltransferase Ste14
MEWLALAMGESWRVGVNETEHTELVTTGPFGLVRNPIFTAVLTTGAGIALVLPIPAQHFAIFGALDTRPQC